MLMHVHCLMLMCMQQDSVIKRSVNCLKQIKNVYSTTLPLLNIEDEDDNRLVSRIYKKKESNSYV